MKRFTILVAVAGLGLAACATGAASSLEPRANGSTAAVESPSTPSHPTSTLPGSPAAGGTGASSEPCDALGGGSENHAATLVDVRVATHEGYDRVTFEFAPPSDGQYFGMPQYEIVAVTPPIRQDGSGDPVDVDGESFAGIVFRGASGWDVTGDTYDGPNEFRPGFEALAEAEQTGDYEAVLSWAFGLKQGSCWTVHELEDPVRVAIDFSH
jgi:hypothetical protein